MSRGARVSCAHDGGRRARWARAAVAVAVALAVLPWAGACRKTVHMYVITTWDADCGGNPRAWDSMVDRWYDTMGEFGHLLAQRFVDGDYDRSLLCDPATGLTDCDDTQYADLGNYVMLGLHGGRSGKHWQGSLRTDGGAGVNDCRIDAPEGSTGEMYLGNARAEFLHLSSCNSMDDDSMPEVWRVFQDPADTTARPDRLIGLTGFHGMMGIGGTYHPDYEEFAEQAQTVSVKDAWMDAMYHPEMSNVKCPVAYSVGVDGDDCFQRLDHANYTSTGPDPAGIAVYCYYYFDGCDPAAEDPFTPP